MTGPTDAVQPDWHSLSHAYGPAVDTPLHLQALRSTDSATREGAWNDLIGSANHQGSLYTVTPWIVGPLIELAADPEYPDRVQAIGHATLIVEALDYSMGQLGASNPSSKDGLLDACRAAAGKRAPIIAGLMNDAARDIRTWAIRLAGVLVRAGREDIDLEDALGDADRVVRAVALWQLLITSPGHAHVRTAAAAIIETAASEDLEYFVANAVLLSADRTNREAAKAIVGLGESVLPEFEAAWLNHVADSPQEFAASVAGMESVADLEALA